jgi:hypothetical protein
MASGNLRLERRSPKSENVLTNIRNYCIITGFFVSWPKIPQNPNKNANFQQKNPSFPRFLPYTKKMCSLGGQGIVLVVVLVLEICHPGSAALTCNWSSAPSTCRAMASERRRVHQSNNPFSILRYLRALRANSVGRESLTKMAGSALTIGVRAGADKPGFLP